MFRRDWPGPKEGASQLKSKISNHAMSGSRAVSNDGAAD